MSRAARFTLVGSIILSGLTVWGVHFLQDWERESMYQGVLRDDERRRNKMLQRQAEYDAELKKRQLFEVAQSVGGSSHEVPRRETINNSVTE